MGVERVGDNLQSIGLSAADAADKLISAALDQTDVGPGWVALWITLAVALSILSWRYYVALPPEAMEGAATKSAAAAKEVKSELLRFWTDRYRCPGAGSDASAAAAELDDRPAAYALTGTVTLRQLARFVIPLSMTNIAIDVGEVRPRSSQPVVTTFPTPTVSFLPNKRLIPKKGVLVWDGFLAPPRRINECSQESISHEEEGGGGAVGMAIKSFNLFDARTLPRDWAGTHPAP